MEHVPRRQSEPRLEQRNDAGGEEEQPEDERREADGETASELRRGAQRLRICARVGQVLE